ncbi:hypothetical protein [Marinimicrobium alkaliphilum]|uniref:hypothetical protein n=1 Tax=Marinimicrobium alkaliphilum TaxID=2202654 RepID=UPI000DBA06AD|nr:hypothetical protein [Marinimicrobium alkaliphilum]
MRVTLPIHRLQPILWASILLTLAACGGSSSDDQANGNGYEGEESAAEISVDNQGDIAMAARASTEDAIVQFQGADLPGLPMGVSLDQAHNERVGDTSLGLIAQAQPSGASTQTIEGECGGNAQFNFEDGDTQVGHIQYNNFCAGESDDTVVINGRVDFEMSDSFYEVRYNNVTFTYLGETHTLNSTISCDLGGTGECSYSSDFSGSDGRTYRASNTQVSGNESTGYNVSARVYDPDHGYVDYQASGITLCSGGGIGSGNITVSDSSGSVLEITFTSCDSMTVTYDGVSETFSQ